MLMSKRTLDYILSRQYKARAELSGYRRKVFDSFTDRGYKYICDGRARIGFLSPNGKWVVKLAKDLDGDADNRKEYDRWKHREGSDWVPLARCKVVNEHVLVMECVITTFDPLGEVHLSHKESLKINRCAWKDYIDCAQVGVNRKGEVVAYDYAQ